MAASGFAEVVLGLLTLLPPHTVLTRWGLTLLLLAVFPANLHMALHAKRFSRVPSALLWLRLPLQGVLLAKLARRAIAWVWRATASNRTVQQRAGDDAGR